MSYVKTTWVTGDIVTAPKLNNLESGVEANDLNKLNKPSGNGTAGQLLISNGDGSTSWTDTDTTLEESGKAADAKATGDAIGEINEALETKAEKDGTYEDLTSGNAEQLLSDVYTDNSEPYFFRKTGGSDKVGSREYLDKIVGGSLAWNQLASLDANNWSVNRLAMSVSGTTITGTATSAASTLKKLYIPIKKDHVYYASCVLTSNGNAAANIGEYRGDGSTYEWRTGVTADAPPLDFKRIFKCARDGNRFQFVLPTSAVIDDYFTAENVQLIDLTSELGATIADYVYSLETATEGSGIAWLKQYIDLDTYHPYSEPTLKHVEGLTSHDTTGLNLWDGTFSKENYYLLGNGNETVSSSMNESISSYIPVIGGQSYYLSPLYGNASALCWYDYDKKYISGLDYRNNTSLRVTAPNNVKYIRFTVYKPNIPNICINLSCSKNGTYEPYQKRSYPLDPSVVLRGYPMLVDGKLKFDGDEYLYNGTINRNYNIVDMGTLNWDVQHDDTDYQDYVSSDLMNIIQTVNEYTLPHIVCQNFVPIERNTQSSQASQKTNTIGVTSTGRLRIVVAPSSYPNVAAFKASLSGTYLVYKKATPTTETAEPFHQLQICDTYGTESFVTTSEVPVGTETRYPEDLKSKIEGLPWDLSMIAPIEDGTTASKAYTTGQYFLHNNVFCKALTSIASGATFTLNTNYTETTVAAELYAALH